MSDAQISRPLTPPDVRFRIRQFRSSIVFAVNTVLFDAPYRYPHNGLPSDSVLRRTPLSSCCSLPPVGRPHKKGAVAKPYKRRVQVLLVKNEKEHAWAINSRNID